MATAAEQDYRQDLGVITMIRNDTFEKPITGLQDSGDADWNFAARFSSARMQVRKVNNNQADRTVQGLLLTFSTDDGTLDMSTAGTITLTQAKVNTNIEAGTYHFDIEFRDASNKDKTLYFGTFEVRNDVTL